jgi:hypothetical protein
MAVIRAWFSVAGLVLELVGFLLIAREWYHGFSQMIVLRQQRVQEDYVRTRKAQGFAYEDTSEGDASMWRNTQRENQFRQSPPCADFLLGRRAGRVGSCLSGGGKLALWADFIASRKLSMKLHYAAS